MEQKKNKEYFTPSTKDIKAGLEYELLSFGVWTKNKVVTFRDQRFLTTSISDLCHAIYEEPEVVRVPYLDQEQIEELGWKHTGHSIYAKVDDYEIDKSDKNSEYNGLRYNLKHFTKSNQICIEVINYSDMGGNEYTLYLGGCKDKNTLRYLMELLGIN
jgi:hypothetical protein